MKACTFFGHRDCPGEIRPKLREVLIDLIENKGVEMFYAYHASVLGYHDETVNAPKSPREFTESKGFFYFPAETERRWCLCAENEQKAETGMGAVSQ